MPLNIPGILAPLHFLINPRIILPGLVVRDIRYIDFTALYNAGYRGVVFDKDNCITLPHKDKIVPDVQDAWEECKRVFGDGNVIIVSNSAGTWQDPGGIQSESVTYHTGVPVLLHRSFKPAFSCLRSIRGYFSSLKRPIHDDNLVIVGDRIFTDVVLANRMRLTRPAISPSDNVSSPGKDGLANMVHGPLAVWTTGVWQKEATILRLCEKAMVHVVSRFLKPNGQVSDRARFIREPQEPATSRATPLKMLSDIFSKFTSRT